MESNTMNVNGKNNNINNTNRNKNINTNIKDAPPGTNITPVMKDNTNLYKLKKLYKNKLIKPGSSKNNKITIQRIIIIITITSNTTIIPNTGSTSNIITLKINEIRIASGQ